MIRIKVPSTPNTEIQVPLDGRLYDLHFTYNNTTKRWYLSIYYNGSLIAGSLKVVEYVNLINKVNPAVLDGGLYVVKFQQTEEPCSRDNFGIGKAYELVYLLRKR